MGKFSFQEHLMYLSNFQEWNTYVDYIWWQSLGFDMLYVLMTDMRDLLKIWIRLKVVYLHVSILITHSSINMSWNIIDIYKNKCWVCKAKNRLRQCFYFNVNYYQVCFQNKILSFFLLKLYYNLQNFVTNTFFDYMEKLYRVVRVLVLHSGYMCYP